MKNFILTATLLLTSALLQAQELATLVDDGLKAMNEKKWEQALALNAQAIEKHGPDPKVAMEDFGPQFAMIWFRKGICELQLKKFADAMKSFEIVSKDFPNNAEKDGNEFEKIALLKWGEAAMGAEKYDVAIEKWSQFLKERTPKDKFPQGLFNVNMAICHYHVGEIPKGNEYLEIAIKNKAAFATPNSAIVSAFQVLVDVSVKAENEQAFLDFVDKNKGGLMIEPFEMQRFSKIFMKLAGDAIAAEKIKTALALYQFVPSTQVAIEDLTAKLKIIGKLPTFTDGSAKLNRAQMEGELAALKAELAGNKSIEMIKLAAIAYIYELQGYVPGSYAAYLQLETMYAKAEKREDNLYNLIRTASLLGKMDQVQKFSETFLTAYPESTHKPAIMKLMLSTLFFRGDYETCIEIASDLIGKEKLKAPSPEHDLALFVLGGSYFYTGKYDVAVPYLEKHIATYPQSPFAMHSSYYQASNTYRLQLWKEAAVLLDKFLEKYKTNPEQGYIPLALLDRANTHYAEDETEATVEKIDRLIKDFPDSETTNQALNLKGNVQESEGKIAEAIATYQMSLEKAEARGNDSIAGEALYYLIALLSSDKSDEEAATRFPKAAAYADKYWEKYSESSPYRAQASVSQLPAMDAVGRGEEGLKRLQGIISEMAKLEEAQGLEEAINSYTEAYLKNHTPEELKEHYFNFPNVDVNDKAARALLRIAVIGVYENSLKKAKDEEEKRKLNAMIKVLFDNLKAEFDVKELTNFILVKLGDYLRTKTATPVLALPYYNEALGRADQAYRFDALLGRADVYGKSKLPDELAKSIEDFERVLSDSDEKSQREFALYRIIQVLMEKSDYEGAAKRANEYLNREPANGAVHGFTKYSAEVGYILAQSFEKRNLNDDAIQMYVKVWSTYMGNIKVSAPAIHSWMELSFARNKPSTDPNTPADRQGAYQGGYNYLELTGRFKNKLTPEELELWTKVQKLTERYVADPSVKSMEEIKKAKEKGQ
ncbi:MAG: tetratricopeptide repeat protein [Verrucomicrobiota bacterium]